MKVIDPSLCARRSALILGDLIWFLCPFWKVGTVVISFQAVCPAGLQLMRRRTQMESQSLGLWTTLLPMFLYLGLWVPPGLGSGS